MTTSNGIAFHVKFDDYTADELCKILNLMVKNHKMKLGGDVMKKVRPIFESAVKSPDFGNGRFVRNLFEKARMKQASRLLRMDVDNVTKADVSRLAAEDFEAPLVLRKQKRQMGFIDRDAV